MDKIKLYNVLYACMFVMMLVFSIFLIYIIFLLKGDGAMCMLQPLEYARDQGLNFIELKEFYVP